MSTFYITRFSLFILKINYFINNLLLIIFLQISFILNYYLNFLLLFLLFLFKLFLLFLFKLFLLFILNFLKIKKYEYTNTSNDCVFANFV